MIIKNKNHLQILNYISELKTKSPLSKGDLEGLKINWVKKYLGTDKIYHGFSSQEMVDLAKDLLKKNNFNDQELIDLLNSLYQNGTTYTEIALAATILSRSPKLLQNFDPQNLDLWLNYTCGWAENDVLCQSNFSSEIVLSNWSNWQKILKDFNHSKNINKRRASLVLLTKSLRQSDDPRLSKLAFQNIENLKSEKEILITKAVSWLLRSLVSFHKQEVLIYLEKNKDTLPKIAYREALSKALTGRKYNNSKKQK